MRIEKTAGWNFRRFIDLILVVYLVLVNFYGKIFVPLNVKFFNRYPLLFPLLLILTAKSAQLLINTTSQKKSGKQKNSRKDEGSFSIFKTEKINRIPKKHCIIALLIFLAVFCVKSYIAKGITTHVVHVDEEIVVNDLTRMLSSHSLDYERYNYPPVFYYTNFCIFNIYYSLALKSEYVEIGNVPAHHWYEFGRQVNAAYGALFVAGVFILCYQIFGFIYALTAAFAVFISPLRLNIDSLFRIQPASDVYLIFVFIILISLLRDPKIYKYVLLSVFVSLAVCSFFIRVIILVPVGLFLILHLFRERRWKKELTIFVIFTLFSTLLLLIPALTHPGKFQEKLKYEREYFERFSKHESVMENTNSYKVITFWTQKDGIGYGIFILAGIGIIIGLLEKRMWGCLAYSLILAHYLFVGSYFTTFNRYSAFLSPFLLLFAFLTLDSVLALNRIKKSLSEKTARPLAAAVIILCLIPFILNFVNIMKDTAKPHNLDLFLQWRDQHFKAGTPTLSAVKSMKIKDSGVVIIPDRYLIRPNWINLASFISKRYKIMLLSNHEIEKYFLDWKTWKRVKSFNEKTGKGGNFYILENNIADEKLKKDTQLTNESIPDRWKQF